jgi:type I restriction enzyme, S subunit
VTFRYEQVRVGDLLSLKRRTVTVELESEYGEIGIRSFGRGIFHKEPVTGAALGSKRVFWIEPGDLVISNVFAWEGAIAVASHAESGRIGSHRFMTFVPVDQRIDITWVAWFFQSGPGLELIRQASPGSAGRNRTLAIERFETIKIPLPPLDEQQRVAQCLDRCSSEVKVIAQKFARTKSTINLTFEGWLGDIIARCRERRELADVAVVARGRGPRYESGSGLFAVNQACVRWGELDLTRAREVAADWWQAVPGDGRIRAGDVLVNSTGEGTIGRAVLTTGLAVGMPFDSHVLIARCNREMLLPAFLAIYLRSRAGQLQVNQAKGANTTKQTELGKTKFERFQVPVPSVDEQAMLVSRFCRVEGKTRLLEEKVAEQEVRLSAIIPSLLNQIFA